MSPNDVFEDASGLALQLRADGAQDHADAINEAVRSGSTGSEILTNLGRELSLLLGDTQVAISETTRASAKRLLKDVNKLLRGS